MERMIFRSYVPAPIRYDLSVAVYKLFNEHIEYERWLR